MDMQTFFKHLHVSPIFRTTRELTLPTMVWRAGEAPKDTKTFMIPAGTLLRVNGYSNFGTGYAMSPRNPAKVFSGKDRMVRFFNCPYDAMEFVEYQ